MKLLLSIVCLFSLANLSFASMPKGTQWQTNYQQARALAQKTQKPLFLYWGAVWCPPCNQMKKTVFSTSEFQKVMKNYVAVYLDGDTKEAQTIGDQLKTMGYPTMIVMHHSGKEIFRLPTGITPEEYIGYLKNFDQGMKNIPELIITPAKNLKDTEWSILAAHSWGQDETSAKDKLTLFKEFFQSAPAHLTLVKSRFFFYYLEQLVEKESPIEDKEVLKKYFLELITQDKLLTDNAYYVSMYTKNAFKLFLNEEEQKITEKQLGPKLWQLYNGQATTYDDRLSLLEAAVDIEEIAQKEMSITTKEKVTKEALKATKISKGEFERQAIIERAITLLLKVKNNEEAKKVAVNELKISKSPFYFMSDLAYIAKLEKNGPEALKWSLLAWENSKGTNSRFRWGVSYLNYLFTFDEDNVKTIHSNLNHLVKEALKNEEAFKGGNKLRFEKIQKLLKDWKTKHESDYDKIKKDLSSLCLSAQDKASCNAWAGLL